MGQMKAVQISVADSAYLPVAHLRIQIRKKEPTVLKLFLKKSIFRSRFSQQAHTIVRFEVPYNPLERWTHCNRYAGFQTESCQAFKNDENNEWCTDYGCKCIYRKMDIAIEQLNDNITDD